ncbi:MAG TPA: alkaline phosphatase family protein [Acidimicrobiales bacterium]|nr:alkaline phosphatase family protein [Acidimicrobiales bacterium]
MRAWLRRALVAALVSGATACGGSGATPEGGASHPTSRVPPASTTPASTAPASTTAAPPECGSASVRPPRVYEHVVWIFMENHTYGQVIGSPAAPFETALAHRCGTATHYASVGSPSLPNYIGATSGDTQGIHDDADPASHPLTADNLFRQVRASGRRAASYEEAMPGPCTLSPQGHYAVKHNPAAYYTGSGPERNGDGDDRAACEADDVALGTPTSGALAQALDGDTLPAFSLITPDLCHDTHDCGVATGDTWLAGWLPRLVASPAYRSGTTAIFVAWDESTPMPSIVVSPHTVPGTVFAGAMDHYSLLRTTEELLGIGDFLGHAARAPSLRPAFGL